MKSTRVDPTTFSMDEVKDALADPTESILDPYMRFVRKTGYCAGEAVELPVWKIIEAADAKPRAIYLEDRVSDLAAHIKTNGLLVPIHVTILKDFENRFVLIDGSRRLRALKLLGVESVRAILVHTYSLLDVYQIGFDLNVGSLTVFDSALTWQTLLKQKLVPDTTALALMVRESEENVAKTLGLAKLPRKAMERLVESPERIGLSAGYELVLFYQAHGEEAGNELTERVTAEGLSAREIAHEREAYGKAN